MWKGLLSDLIVYELRYLWCTVQTRLTHYRLNSVCRSINAYLHFKSSLHAEMAQIIWNCSSSNATPWLLLSWPRHQQTCIDQSRVLYLVPRKESVNSMTHRTQGINFYDVIFKHAIQNCSLGTRCEIATEPHLWNFNIGSDNGLVPSRCKQLLKPMLNPTFSVIWRHYATMSWYIA